MTKQQFTEKYGLRGFDSVEDVLMTIASNLSDLQHSSRNLNGKINNIKEFIFDYQSVIRYEARMAGYEEQEMREFNSHLG